MVDATELSEVVYNEIINIFFVLRVGKKQRVVEKKQIIDMLFGGSLIEGRVQVAHDTLRQLLAEKKIKRVGDPVYEVNYQLSDETWAELSGQMKKAMGDK